MVNPNGFTQLGYLFHSKLRSLPIFTVFELSGILMSLSKEARNTRRSFVFEITKLGKKKAPFNKPKHDGEGKMSKSFVQKKRLLPQ